MDIHRERAQGRARLRRATEDRDHQWAQTNADLHAQCAPAGVDRVIEVRRKKNMPVTGSNIVKIFELQADVPPR